MSQTSQSISGWKGQRLKRPQTKRVLDENKDDIIQIAVEYGYEDYSPDWLAEQVLQSYENDLPLDTTEEEIEKYIWEWDEEIRDAIKLSLEPTEVDEAWASIRRETINNIRRYQ